MMTIIDLARNIRERHNKPLKAPLRLSLSLVASAVSLSTCSHICHPHYCFILFRATAGRW